MIDVTPQTPHGPAAPRRNGHGAVGRADAEHTYECVGRPPADDTYRRLLDALPAAVYTTDAQGRVTLYNRAAAALWGREPRVGKDLWCGSWRIFRPDGVTPVPLDTCPMAAAIHEGRPIRGEEIVIERPDGSRRNVLPHPEPIRDDSGALVGAFNLLVDVTDRRRIEHALRQSESRFRAIFGQAAVGIALVNLDGRLVEVNDRLGRILGRSTEELRALSCADLTHPDDWPCIQALFADVAAARRREFSIEKRDRHADGSWVWVNVSVSPLLDERGRPDRLVLIVEDITERRQFRAELERIVQLRTAELDRAHRQLRQHERLASLGTLSAGLGHDLANLILPLRARLDGLDPHAAPEQLADDLDAIRRGLDYLQHLSAGLRLMAVDPATRSPGQEHTDLASWWAQAEGVLRAVLPRGTRLEAGIAAGLPRIAIGRAELMQAVFNLVQNSAEAMGDRGDGLVSIAAEAEPAAPDHPPRIRLTVADNGPGMPAEVLAHCFEPYFSTKARVISTGMGLPLVRSAVVAAGGTISCDTDAGRGTRFTITLPADPVAPLPVAAPRAAISVAAPRNAALAAAVLDALGAGIGRDDDRAGADLWVTDRHDPDQIAAFLDGAPGRCVVVWNDPPPPADAAAATSRIVPDDRAFYCGAAPDLRTVRATFERALHTIRGHAAA